MKKYLLAGIAALSASPALAGGFYLQEQSPLGVGRAFAGEAAIADDASTIFYNPAGMTKLGKVTVTAGGHLLFLGDNQTDLGSTRTVPGLPTPVATGGNDGGNPFDKPVVVPSGYAAFQFADSDVWVGLGFSAPFGVKVVYNDGWFGRYDSVKSDLKTINIQPSIAWKINDTISIGGGVDFQKISAELTNALPNPSPLLPDGSLSIEGDDFSIGWNAGILGDFGGVRVGAHYRSPVKHVLRGQVVISGLQGPLAAANGSFFATAPISTPDIATGSIVVGADKPLRFLASASWYNWSRFEAIVVEPVGSNTLDSEQNYKDTWSFSGGVEYDLSDRLTLRGGAMFDQTPTRDAFRTTRVPDGDRTWLTAGASIGLNSWLTANLSYAHVFVKSEEVNRTDPLFAGTPVQVLVSTRAENRGHVNIAAASLTARF